jgi:hypothetical protein
VSRSKAEESCHYDSDCDPFKASGVKGDRAAVLLAAAAEHPDESFRLACRRCIEGALGHDRIRSAIDAVQRLVLPHNDDVLEPMALDDGACFIIAAMQSLSSRSGFEEDILRITSADGPDRAGGVELTGLKGCSRVTRRSESGSWNLAKGSMFHPAQLRNWVSEHTWPRHCRVLSDSDQQHAILTIPGHASGIQALRAAVDALWHLPESALPDTQWSGPSTRARRRSEELALPEGACRYWFGLDAQLRRSMDEFDKALKVNAVGFSTAKDHGASLGKMGCKVALGPVDMHLRFETPESIMRLTAMASERVAMKVRGIRPLGWLMCGRGEDDIRFVPSAHVAPPTWIWSPWLAELSVPRTIARELARWRGPFADEADLDFLETFL